MLDRIIKIFSKYYRIIGKICFGAGSVLWVAASVTAFCFPDAITALGKVYTIGSSAGATVLVLGAVLLSHNPRKR